MEARKKRDLSKHWLFLDNSREDATIAISMDKRMLLVKKVTEAGRREKNGHLVVIKMQIMSFLPN